MAMRAPEQVRVSAAGGRALTCARNADEELVHHDEGRLDCVVHINRPVERVFSRVENSMHILLCLCAFGTDLSTLIQFLNC